MKISLKTNIKFLLMDSVVSGRAVCLNHSITLKGSWKNVCSDFCHLNSHPLSALISGSPCALLEYLSAWHLWVVTLHKLMGSDWK